MNRVPLIACLLALALCAAATLSRPAAAELRYTETTGTLLGFDDDSGLLNVNTRLGPSLFLVTLQTLVLVNNHGGDLDDLLPGDQVELTYRFDTREVRMIHVTREASIRGEVVRATNNGIDVMVGDGAVVTFRQDTRSRLDLGGLQATNIQHLVGRPVTVVYEPGSMVLLSLAGRAPRIRGTVGTVDATGQRITLAGRRGRILTTDSTTAITRNGQVIALRDLRAADRVDVVFVRDRRTERALIIRARGLTPVVEASGR